MVVDENAKLGYERGERKEKQKKQMKKSLVINEKI